MIRTSDPNFQRGSLFSSTPSNSIILSKVRFLLAPTHSQFDLELKSASFNSSICTFLLLTQEKRLNELEELVSIRAKAMAFMAYMKLTFVSDNNSHESNKQIFAFNSWEFAPVSLFWGHVSSNGSFMAKPFCTVQNIRISRSENEVLDSTESKTDGSDNSKMVVVGNEDMIIEDQDFDEVRMNIWKKFRVAKTTTRNMRRNLDSGRNSYRKDKTTMPRKNVTGCILAGKSDSGFDFGDVQSDLSIEQCNLILEKLEKSDDCKTMSFFKWMKANGKLNKNVTAYNLMLRVLGRKEDWDGAEIIVVEMVSDSCCELSCRTFNTLIYTCYKSGLVALGTRWFSMMLDYKVEPNIATFGMLMSLYQKGWAVEEAESTFSHMRNLKIACQSAYSAMITIYTRKGLYDKAEDVIGFLRQDEVVLNRENWLVLLNAYCQQGKLPEAEQVWHAMRGAGFTPGLVAYNTMITGCGRASKMARADSLLCNLKEEGLVPDAATYRSLIEGWGRSGNYMQTEFYYKELKKLGLKPSSSNLLTLIRLQAQHKDVEGAIRSINDMVNSGCSKSSILGLLLQTYEKAQRLEQVPLILEGTMYDHVRRNQISCATLVTAYVKNCFIDNALRVLKDMQLNDPVFEDNLYHLLLCLCKDFGHLGNAIKIFTCMPKSAKPNLNIFCTMIDIYSKMDMFTEAKKLYTELTTSGVKLDMIAFSIILRMYVKSGSLKEACNIIDLLVEEKNIVPDVYLVRDMLRTYQQCGIDGKLANLYYQVVKKGEIWDEEMYNCIINCCANALPVDELSKLFEEMVQRGYIPNTITCNVMLNAYGKARLFDKTRKVFWTAKKQGLIDVISYNTMVSAYGRNKYFKNMSATIKQMQFDGFTVSLEAYNSMLDAYGKKGEMDKLRSILQMMKDSNCKADHYTYNILINIYGTRGWIEEVTGVLLELKEGGIRPDLCSYNSLIKAYGIAGMVDDAVALVREMRENQVEPDRITYTNLIQALRRNDMFLEAVKWSLWMKQLGL